MKKITTAPAAAPAETTPVNPALKQPEIKPPLIETKEQAFKRIMNYHVKALANRYRIMRKTANSHRPCQNDVELICIAVENLSTKFISVLKARVQEESDTTFDIFK
jgi:hypothetical protein